MGDVGEGLRLEVVGAAQSRGVSIDAPGVTVRRSLHEDIPFILQELKHFADFFGSKLSLFPTDQAVAYKIIKRLMDDHLFFTSVSDGELSGFIAGWVTVHPFNPAIIQLCEALWWVAGPFRKTRAGSLLLDTFTDWGKQNVDWITMTLEANSPVRGTSIFKRGFVHKETSYIYEVE